MDATWHPATGEVLDSKSRFREATRASGCVEVGDQALPATPQKRESLKADIAATLSGYGV